MPGPGSNPGQKENPHPFYRAGAITKIINRGSGQPWKVGRYPQKTVQKYAKRIETTKLVQFLYQTRRGHGRT